MMLQGFGMICLMMCIRSLLSIPSDGSSIPTLTFSFPGFLSMVSTLAMSQDYDYCLLVLFGAPRVYHQIEIRCYKILLGQQTLDIFIAPNLHLRIDSRRTKQKQEIIIIILRQSRGQHHREKNQGKEKVRVGMLMRRDRS